MSDVLDVALALAAHGVPVFPCGTSKRPCIPSPDRTLKAGQPLSELQRLGYGHGFLDASTDPREIAELFSAEGARLVGVPTGERVGFDIFDVDYRNGGGSFEAANLHRLPETRTHRTLSGGRHYLFRHVRGVRNNASRLADGIDIRGDGGYAIMPPSAGYAVESDAEIAEWPDWLLELVLARPVKDDTAPPVTEPREPLSSRRLEAFVEACCRQVSNAHDGAKHYTLLNMALSIGGVLDQAGMSEGDAAARLMSALPASTEDRDAAAKTAAWGLSQGRLRPLVLPDRPQFARRSKGPNGSQPPPYVTEPDGSNEWLDARASEEANRGEPEIEPIKAAKYGVSLWVIREAWQSKDIPIRPWIARGYLMRRSITVVSGAGAAGKSSLMIAWSTALAVDCAFRNLRANGPIKVATYNVEDDEYEQKRRFSAMLMRLKLAPDAFADRLAILGPAGVGTLLTVGRDGGVVLNTTVMNELETFVEEFKPDVLILDPFVELHGAEENDNTAVRSVLARFRAMAVEHDMAVVILHHARKGTGDPGDPDSLRGASSIVGAARIVLTVAVMAKDEAGKFGISEKNRRLYFRLDGAKSNYAAPEEAEWFERQEITLDNGGDDEPADRVAVAWPWKPPPVGAGIPPDDLNRVLTIIAEPPAGWFYAPHRRGKDHSRWAGKVLCDVTGCTPEQAANLIAAWLKSGLLLVEEYWDDTQGKNRNGVRVDYAKRPT